MSFSRVVIWLKCRYWRGGGNLAYTPLKAFLLVYYATDQASPMSSSKLVSNFPLRASIMRFTRKSSSARGRGWMEGLQFVTVWQSFVSWGDSLTDSGRIRIYRFGNSKHVEFSSQQFVKIPNYAGFFFLVSSASFGHLMPWLDNTDMFLSIFVIFPFGFQVLFLCFPSPNLQSSCLLFFFPGRQDFGIFLWDLFCAGYLW